MSTDAQPFPLPNGKHSDDSEPVWGLHDEVPNQEWSKMDEDFTNAGYREGITAGKESALQEGFDDGFANVGAPLGREIGILRGTANAVANLLSSPLVPVTSPPEGAEEQKNEARAIVEGLGRIHLADLAPRDVQAEDHAREHLDDSGDTRVGMGGNVRNPSILDYQLALENSAANKPAVEELNRLRVRLLTLLRSLEYEVSLE